MAAEQSINTEGMQLVYCNRTRKLRSAVVKYSTVQYVFASLYDKTSFDGFYSTVASNEPSSHTPIPPIRARLCEVRFDNLGPSVSWYTGVMSAVVWRTCGRDLVDLALTCATYVWTISRFAGIQANFCKQSLYLALNSSRQLEPQP